MSNLCRYCFIKQKYRHFGRRRRNPFGAIGAIERFLPSSVSRVIHCQEPGCGRATQEGKSFCIDHITKTPYAQKIISIRKAIRNEQKAVREIGKEAIRKDSVVVNDILKTLSIEGSLLQGELAKKVNISYDTLLVYLDRLKSWKLVTVKPESRKSERVSLLDPEKLVRLEELSQEIRLHSSTIRRLIKKGAPHYKEGERVLLFNPNEFREWYREYKARINKKHIKILKKAKGSYINKTKSRIVKEIAKERGNTDFELLDRKEIEERLGVTSSTVSYWLIKGVPNIELDGQYLGGKKSNKLRFFILDEVVAWYESFKEEAMHKRKYSQYLGDDFWNDAIQYAMNNSLEKAAEKFGVSRDTLTRKIGEAGIDIWKKIAISDRTMTAQEVAPILNVKPITIYKWANAMGAPHDRAPQVTNREALLFNPEELQQWYSEYQQQALQKKEQKFEEERQALISILIDLAEPASGIQLSKIANFGYDKTKIRLNDLVSRGDIQKSGNGGSVKYSI